MFLERGDVSACLQRTYTGVLHLGSRNEMNTLRGIETGGSQVPGTSKVPGT